MGFDRKREFRPSGPVHDGFGRFVVSVVLFELRHLTLFNARALDRIHDASGELELRYKLGFGVFSGQAYGMIPLRYSNDGSVGKDATGKWLREDGLFKLSFREFKKTNDDESGKKRWQYLSPGATNVD